MKPPDPLLGTVIDGRYQINARLARGGMATVYRATDTRLQRSVAIKIIHAHLAEQSDFVSRFIREARSAAKLSSNHLVNVHDQGVASMSDGERPYLVMELINGPDLRSELNQHGSLPLGVALEITRQVLLALGNAHENDVIHRDVKPENVMLVEALEPTRVLAKPDIHAKVADFGLARAASDATSTQTNTMLGTVAYVAPELVSTGSAGPTADVYSTGVMLYELIAGALPFTGESPLAVAYQHVNETLPRLAEQADWMPPAIDSLIALLTAKNPSKRPQNGKAALDALTDIIDGLPEEVLIKRIPVFPVERNEKTKIEGDRERTEQPNATQVLERSLAARSVSDDDAVVASSTARHRKRTRKKDRAAKSKQAGSTGATAHRYDTATIERPRKRHPLRWLLALLALLLLAGGAYGVYWWFDSGPGKRVAVTDVSGMPLEQAQQELAAAGFTNVDEEREFSDTVDLDSIISTDPAGGELIHPEEQILLLVSDGVEHLNVPAVEGLSGEGAQDTLKNARFEPVVEEAYSETVSAGNVISQIPAAGESVPHSSQVTITVSLGREPIAVPSVVNVTRDEAVNAINAQELNPSITEVYSDTVAEGLVVSQDPTPDSTLFRGDTVELVVSLGPELVEVPNVFWLQEGPATDLLEEQGFHVEYDRILGGIFGTVRDQSPAAGTLVEPGTTITLTIV